MNGILLDRRTDFFLSTLDDQIWVHSCNKVTFVFNTVITVLFPDSQETMSLSLFWNSEYNTRYLNDLGFLFQILSFLLYFLQNIKMNIM